MPCFHHIYIVQFSRCNSSTQAPYRFSTRSAYATRSECAHFAVSPLPRQTLALVCLRIWLLTFPASSLPNLLARLRLKPDVSTQFLGYSHPTSCSEVGGDSRDRTGDLLLARQALSQLSYIPVLPSFRQVVGPSGLEPPTLRLSVVRSSQLSYGPVSTSPGGSVPSKLNNERGSVLRTLPQSLARLTPNADQESVGFCSDFFIHYTSCYARRVIVVGTNRSP